MLFILNNHHLNSWILSKNSSTVSSLIYLISLFIVIFYCLHVVTASDEWRRQFAVLFHNKIGALMRWSFRTVWIRNGNNQIAIRMIYYCLTINRYIIIIVCAKNRGAAYTTYFSKVRVNLIFYFDPDQDMAQ